MTQTVQTKTTGGTLTILLDRPEVHNAFSDALIADLIDCFSSATRDDYIRSIVLTGAGKSFCAGADLSWMKQMTTYSREQNIEDSRKILSLYDTIASCPKPVIGRINGPAFGGGAGLVAVCDLAVTVPEATFGFTEVKLGLIPAVISTYVAQRLSPAAMRRLFLTGERFDAATALAVGLVDAVVPAESLDTTVSRWVSHLQTSGPQAMREVKELIRTMVSTEMSEYKSLTVETIARLRTSEEGQEGMAAFLEKRKPRWSEESCSRRS
jgi:methylglutaconyl-CoA hydratase